MPNQHACFVLQSLLPLLFLVVQPGLQLGPECLEQMRGLELGSAVPAPAAASAGAPNPLLLQVLEQGGLGVFST